MTGGSDRGRAPIDIAEAAALLNDQCESIVEELIPDARRQGPRYVCRGLLGGKGDQTSIHLQGSTRGRWRCFAGADIPGAPDSGDMLDLAAWVLYGGDKRKAFAWALQRLGYDATAPDARADLERRRAEARKAAERRKAEADDEDNRRMGQAFHLWNAEARPILTAAGEKTLAARYLEGRGIVLDRIPSLGALRFHPRVALQRGEPTTPAMASIMVDSLGSARACHLTALEERDDGTVGKSRRVARAKVIWGRPRGAFVAINRGRSGKTMRHAPDGDALLICEGIEDALTLAMAAPHLRIIAAGTLVGMGQVAPPATLKTITLYRDADDKPAARAAFDRALAEQMDRAAKIGREIRVTEPPPGFKDANDALLGKRKGGAAA